MKIMLSKALVFAVIVLFIGVGVVPSISSDNEINPITKTIYVEADGTASKTKINNGSLSGYVTDPSINPIEGARVRVYFHETYEENYTDASGYYNVTNIPICYCLKNATASKNGYTTEWVLLSIVENTTHDFILAPLYDVYVDDDADPGWYDATHVKTIQEGIDNATAGDTVFVYHGSYDYFEIDKVLYLIGEDKNTTFIDGGLKISADRVNISGFTIHNALKSGLYVASSNNSIFNNNIINNGYAGIDLRSNSDSIYENYIANNPTGISCAGSNHEIVGNTIKDSEYDGISLVPSNNNNISNNILINNGLSIWHPWFYSYYHNVVLNNTVNGKPLIYIERGIDTTLAMDTGQIILINCNNITILNQNISNSSVGIMLWNTSNCSISNSVTYGQYYGIFMWNSTGNEILNNVVSNNTIGVFHISSLNSIIFSNTILNNFLGISIGNSLNNSVIKNKISHNNYGITLNNSCYNQVYHNIFIDNNQNAQDAGTNIWDNGYPSGGNYWDDYTGTDADGDGIGDTPYDIPSGSNQDLYPLGYFHPIANYTYTPSNPTTADIIYFTDTSIDPDGIIVNWTWDFGYGNISYLQNPTHQYNDSGIYPVALVVTDNNGGTDTVSKLVLVDFQMMPISNVSAGWNFISSPYNLTQDSREFIIKHGGYYYNWTQATTDINPTGAPLIDTVLFGWDRIGQYYTSNDTLEPGFGYWLYAYQPCEVWNQEDYIPVDTYITDLKENWNIIGVPYDQSIAKANITIQYNGTDYNWTEAIDPVNGPIIDSFIFGWNRGAGGQIYQAVDVLEPGYSYWMYSYYDCTLRRS